MKLNEFNSLVDLFFYQAEKENPNTSFLEWLNPKNRKKFTWGETSENIHKLAKVLKDNITDGDSGVNQVDCASLCALYHDSAGIHYNVSDDTGNRSYP